MKGKVSVVFVTDIQANIIKKMFPLGSLLVVDGTLFGPCDVVGTNNKIMGPSLNRFLLIKKVSVYGQEVNVFGEVALMNYLFSHSISYLLAEHYMLTLELHALWIFQLRDPTTCL